jgi:uncharacterized protein (UPF0179 family)
MGTVTLIGTRLADEGTEFVYRGESGACEDCPYRNQCLNLTEGRRYRVTGIRDNASTLDCAVHDGGVTAVEVEPTTVTANVPASEAFVGNKTTLAGHCPHTGCPSHEFCEPAGAEFDVEYRVSEVLGDPPHDHCPLGRELTQVEFEAPEE